jgi:hypothetical protein
VARLVIADPGTQAAHLRALEGLVHVDPSFYDEMMDEDLTEWSGRL